MSRRGKKPRGKGFSSDENRPFYGRFLQLTHVRGREKRQFLNRISGAIIASLAIVAAVMGYSWFGWIGGIVGFLVADSIVGVWQVNGRYIR